MREDASPTNVVPRSLLLSVEEGDSTVGVYDSISGELLRRIGLGYVNDTQREVRQSGGRHRSYVGMWPHEIALTPDHQTAYVTHFGLKDYDELIGATGCTISEIDVIHMCEVRRLYTYGVTQDHSPHSQQTLEREYYKYRCPHGAKVTPDGKTLLVNTEVNLLDSGLPADEQNNHRMLIYDLESLSPFPSRVWDIPEKTHNFILSEDGACLWLFAGPAGISLLDAKTGDVIKQTPSPQGAIRGLVLTRDENWLIASGSGAIHILDPMTLKLVKTISVSGVRQFLYAQVTPDNRFLLAPAVWEGQVVVIDLERETAARRISLGSDPVHVKLAPGAQSAFVTHGRDNFLSELDCRHLPGIQEIRRIPTRDGPNGLAIASPGRLTDRDGQLAALPRQKALRFGACLPLSGGNIVEGQDMRLGYQYWRDSVNARGGLLIGDDSYRVELTLRDTRSQSKGPAADALIEQLTRDLIAEADNDGVPLYLLGAYPTPPNISSGKVAAEAGIPLVTAGAAGVVVYQLGLENVFGVMSPARGFLNNTLDMLLAPAEQSVPPDDTGMVPTPIPTRLKPKTFLMISSDDFGAFQDAVTTSSYGITQYKIQVGACLQQLQQELISDQQPRSYRIKFPGSDAVFERFRIVRDPAPPTGIPGAPGGTFDIPLIAYEHPEDASSAKAIEQEFVVLLEHLHVLAEQGKGSDVVSLTAHMPQAVAFVKAAAKVWPAPRQSPYPQGIILSVGPGNPAFAQQLGAASLNLIGTSVWSPNQRGVGVDEFIESRTFFDKFSARFHKSPSYLTAGAVACGLVYEEALARAGSIRHDEVRAALQSISDPAVYPDNPVAGQWPRFPGAKRRGPVDLFYSRIDFRWDGDAAEGDPPVKGLNDARPLGTVQLRRMNGAIADMVLWPASLIQDKARLVWPFPGFPEPDSREDHH